MKESAERGGPRPAASVGVVILGMHRSGTSLLSGLLGELGFEFGGPVFGSTPSNPRGHWEHAGVVHAHETFLASIGHHWSDPGPIREELFQSDAAAQARSRLESMFEQDFLPHERWVVKDPRQCRLLPLWDGIRADPRSTFRFVHIVRNPLDVAASLAARDHLPIERSLLLWLWHSLDAELGTRDDRRVWIAFDDLVRSPAKTLAGLSKRLGISGLGTGRVSAAITTTLDPALVHHDVGEARPPTEQSFAVPLVGQTWHALRLLTAGETPQARNELDHVRAELARHV